MRCAISAGLRGGGGVKRKHSKQAEMQFLLQMCYAPTVCHDTLPVALRLSYECSSVLITDLLRSSRYKAIPHGSTALTDISHRLHTSPTDVTSVGFTRWALQQLQLYKSTLQNHFGFLLYRGARASVAQALDGLGSCAVVSG